MLKQLLYGCILFFLNYAALGMEGTSQETKQSGIAVKTSDDTYITFGLSSIAYLPTLEALVKDIAVNNTEQKPLDVAVLPFNDTTLKTIKALVRRLKKCGFKNMPTECLNNADWPAKAVVAASIEESLYSRYCCKDLVQVIKAANFLDNPTIVAAGCHQLARILATSYRCIINDIFKPLLETLPSEVLEQIHDVKKLYTSAKSFDTSIVKALYYNDNILVLGKSAKVEFWKKREKAFVKKRRIGNGIVSNADNYVFSPNGRWFVYTISSSFAWPHRSIIRQHKSVQDWHCGAAIQNGYTIDNEGTLFMVDGNYRLVKKSSSYPSAMTTTTILSCQQKPINGKKVSCLAVSGDGMILAFGEKHSINLYDIKEEKIVGTLMHQNLKSLFIIDNFLLSVGKDRIKVWDILRAKQICERRAPGTREFTSAALNIRDGCLAATTDQTLEIYDLCSGGGLRVKSEKNPFIASSFDQSTGAFAAATKNNVIVLPVHDRTYHLQTRGKSLDELIAWLRDEDIEKKK